MKHTPAPSQWDVKMRGIVHASRAVALRCRWLGARTGGQRPERRVRAGSNASYLFVRCWSEARLGLSQLHGFASVWDAGLDGKAWLFRNRVIDK